MLTTQNQYSTEQVLLGLGEIFPQEELIFRLRYFLENLIQDKAAPTTDLMEVLKLTGEYPALPHLALVLESDNPRDQLISLFRLMEHLSYSSLEKNLKVILKFFDISQENYESCYNSTLLMLDECSKEKGYEYLFYLRQILLEEDKLTKLKKVLDFLIYIYECPKIIQLKKMLDHFVKLDNDLQVWKFLMEPLSSKFIERIKAVRAMYPEVDLHECFSKSQVLSKLWICDEIINQGLEDKIARTLVLCGWYATLPMLLFEKVGEDRFLKMRSLDIDSSCLKVAETLNEKQKNNNLFRVSTADVYDIDFQNIEIPLIDNNGVLQKENGQFDLIINTSCEHLKNFSQWYSSLPDGQLLILQSNNFFDCEGHVNCINSLDEFKKMAPMSEYLYQGSLPLEKYTRFMLIGRK